LSLHPAATHDNEKYSYTTPTSAQWQLRTLHIPSINQLINFYGLEGYSINLVSLSISPSSTIGRWWVKPRPSYHGPTNCIAEVHLPCH
jgi:hypothetical protein